nr:MAG TPA: hypothetical protein [Caudoviricetes sp.]
MLSRLTTALLSMRFVTALSPMVLSMLLALAWMASTVSPFRVTTHSPLLCLTGPLQVLSRVLMLSSSVALLLRQLRLLVS